MSSCNYSDPFYVPDLMIVADQNTPPKAYLYRLKSYFSRIVQELRPFPE